MSTTRSRGGTDVAMEELILTYEATEFETAAFVPKPVVVWTPARP